MERIFEVVCGQLAEVFEVDHIAVYRLDSSEAGLSLIYGSGFSEESLQQLRDLKSDLGVFKRLIDTQIPQVVNDMPQTETGLLPLAQTEGFESMIAVPLFSQDRMWGILAAFSSEPHRFKEQDAKIVSLLAGQLGVLDMLLSAHLRDNLDDLLVQVLGSIELLGLRYGSRTTVSVPELLHAHHNLKERILSFVAKVEQTAVKPKTWGKKKAAGDLVLPSGDELSIEEVITVKGEKNLTPKKKKVLVIDDQPIVTDLLVSVLERMNYESEVASSGTDGLEAFRRDGFDLVITDLGMPDVSGWDVSKQVKERNPKVPVVVITGWGVDPDPNRMKESKADLIMYKPFQIEELEKSIRGLLQK